MTLETTAFLVSNRIFIGFDVNAKMSPIIIVTIAIVTVIVTIVINTKIWKMELSPFFF